MAAPAIPTDGTAGAGTALERLRKRPDIGGRVFQVALLSSLLFTLLVLVVLVVQVLGDGSSVLTGRLGSFLTSGLSSRAARAGIAQGLRGTFYLCLITALVAFPLGIGAAIYLEEYAPRNKLTTFIDINIRNLAGVPSVVYGILGLTIFVKGVGFRSLTGGST
ncbi:MAG TPA: hypothetical protein VFK43_01035, partial [Acidimicrobiales bacterium]|nr:hypothetical protein [Acidimicrobiales bacterium]